ncbi:MAG: A/G-specific adenine glycosylase [Bacillota bacterium]|nr:A/G-specific adenine glycosylase [Bacillota bacterium]
MEQLKEIVIPLLEWFQLNKRDLPWRKTKEPYHIWLSEIMLQQTRVEAVKPYYERFLQTLPTIRSLAEADEETILKLWEGLGYYSRVRNMQKAANQIITEHQGIFPSDHASILKLKGIGPYTAGAIGSIAFGLPVAAVDGNVLRVMSRITADASDISLASTKKAWEEKITEIMPPHGSGDFNQALMELGATVCLPNGMPRCDICPVRKFCQAYRSNTIQIYPVKAEKKARTQVSLNVFFCVYKDRIAIRKRQEKGVLFGLWELPNVERDCAIPMVLQEIGISQAEITPMKAQKHIFTHIEWQMDCYYIKVKEKPEGELLWVTEEEMESAYALPSAFRKIWIEGIETKKNAE